MMSLLGMLYELPRQGEGDDCALVKFEVISYFVALLSGRAACVPHFFFPSLAHLVIP